MSLRIKTGDLVEVISGKDTGKRGRVLRVEVARERVVVARVNMIKRHTKPRQGASASSPEAQGGVIEKEAAIHISNVQLIDPQDDRPTRVGSAVVDGHRVRISRRSGARID